MKIIYMGTSEFAVPSLEALAAQYEVVAVVTQPDRPKGRSGKPAPPPVKEVAQKLGITVLQPESAKKKAFTEVLAGFGADIVIVASYGQILPVRVLELPKYGCLNVHASLLPRHRGASPIQMSIVCGDDKTGVTIMQMDKGLDTGDILLKREVPIEETDTAQTLHDKLAVLGADAILDTLKLIVHSELAPQPQNHDEATYAHMLTKETGCIDWTQKPTQIVNLVRGLDPWPGAYTMMAGHVLKIWEAELVNIEIPPNAVAGQVIIADARGLVVCANGGAVRLSQIQAPGGRRMADVDYLKGRNIALNIVLG